MLLSGGSAAVRLCGTAAASRRRGASLLRLIRALSPNGEGVSFCYEAGACGYGVYREIVETGHRCEVVAPSLIPRRSGERVKTDRRDALMLARLHRAGELRAVWVPDEEQEAMRDLTRAREDLKGIELKARQCLGAFLLRHGRVYREGRSRWTAKHFRWLEEPYWAGRFRPLSPQKRGPVVHPHDAFAVRPDEEGRAYGALVPRADLELVPRPGGAVQRHCGGLQRQGQSDHQKAFGHRTCEALEVALYHTLGDLPEPGLTPRFC